MVFTKEELIAFFKQQRKVFDIVRLVDVSMTKEYSLSESGEILSSPYQCYAVWNKNHRCENCISAKAYAIKGKLSKFEFVDNEIYFVISSYSTVDGNEYMVEMVLKLNDDTMFGTYGKNCFIESIENFNKKLYVDALTGAYNRHYYNEQLARLKNYNATAIIDVDNFKAINDTYGHTAGDYVLKEVVKILKEQTRAADAVIRFGGDEFLLILQDMSADAFIKKLEELRLAVLKIKSPEYPELTVSVSIGAVCCNDKNNDLIETADNALYQAKIKKNRIILKTESKAFNK